MPYPLAGITFGLSEVGRVLGVFVPEEGGGGMSVLSTRNVFFLGLGASLSFLSHACSPPVAHLWGSQTCRNDGAT